MIQIRPLFQALPFLEVWDIDPSLLADSISTHIYPRELFDLEVPDSGAWAITHSPGHMSETANGVMKLGIIRLINARLVTNPNSSLYPTLTLKKVSFLT